MPGGWANNSVCQRDKTRHNSVLCTSTCEKEYRNVSIHIFILLLASFYKSTLETHTHHLNVSFFCLGNSWSLVMVKHQSERRLLAELAPRLSESTSNSVNG